MEASIELETSARGTVRFTLKPPGAGDGFFVLCPEFSGNKEFWALLERLAASAGQPMWKFDESLREQGLFLGDLTVAARQKLFRLSGYGLGTLLDAHPMLRDGACGDKRSVLFIRDPRDMICTMFLHGAWRPAGDEAAEKPPSLAEFIASPRIELLLARYRRLAAFRENNPLLRMVRYEQALAGWSGIADDLVRFLNLDVDPAVVSAIAADAKPVGNRLPWQAEAMMTLPRRGDPTLSSDALERLEHESADILAALGFAYRPSKSDHRKSDHAKWGQARLGDAPASAAEAPPMRKAGEYAPPKLAIFEPDPVIFGRLRPNSAAPMQVLGRQVMMEVDASGCRPVSGQPEAADRTVAFYGCSFTYGVAVASEETFASRVQQMLPAWRVENHGISGHGTAQNLLLLQRHVRWSQPEHVVFCWIGHHLIRNVVDIHWVQSMSRRMRPPPPGSLVPQRFPRAALDASGTLAWRSTVVPRAELQEFDWSDFSTEPFYQSMVCLRLFEEADRIVRGYGGKFSVITLWGQPSAVLSGWLADAGIAVLDASLNGSEYTCMPDDPHPNARAHAIYAERIAAYLARDSAPDTAPVAVSSSPAWPIGAIA